MGKFGSLTSGGHHVSDPSSRWFQMAPWATYTPTWTNGTVNPTVGNATLTGRYRLDGTTMHLQVRFVVGSTSTVGSGTPRLSIPSGVTPGPMQQFGVAFWYDASTGIGTRGVSVLDPAATFIYPWLADGTSPGDASGLANGDVIHCGGTFEIG